MPASGLRDQGRESGRGRSHAILEYEGNLVGVELPDGGRHKSAMGDDDCFRFSYNHLRLPTSVIMTEACMCCR
jgi:hypothetical protein